MIIKLHRRGRSFTGVVRYLTHDPDKAASSDRLAWTYTLNLANDDIPSAVDEMLWTYRSADQLKRAAGVATSGSRLDRPVKHFSLSWHVSESPTRDEMIGLVRRYLKHMGMEDRQAILFSHNDTAHAHVHVVVNIVSPEDGRALKTSFEHRRTQAFALAYERERGLIFCEERLKPVGQREKSMTRPAHESFKKAEKNFQKDERKRIAKTPDFFARGSDKPVNGKEWEALKAHQCQQRESYKAGGKQAFKAVRNQVYKEVRQEFRGQWKAFYAARRSGGSAAELAAMKSALVQAQQKALDERRDAAFEQLRERRDKEYEVVLAQQQVDRDALREQQARGLRTYRMFDVIYPAPEPVAAVRDVSSRGNPWRVGQAMPERDATSSRFDASARSLPNPAGGDDRGKPATVIRGEGGRVTNKERNSGEGSVAPPRSVPVEMTEARVEAQRATQAREMTDRERDKQRVEGEAIVRASWNRHRRFRGRRD